MKSKKKNVAINSYKVGLMKGKILGMLSIPPRYKIASGLIDYWVQEKQLKYLRFNGEELIVKLVDPKT